MTTKRRYKKPAVFLDRDGVINEPPEHRYITRWEEFRFVPGSLQAIRVLSRHEVTLVIVSNQSGVGRGVMSKPQLNEVSRRMLTAIRRVGGKIHAVYYCTHHPDRNCSCRKPRTGMIRKAVKRFGIDLKRSYVIGDSEVDILMARSAGCGKILVLSGRHNRSSAKHLSVQPDRIAKDLRAAAGWILRELP